MAGWNPISACGGKAALADSDPDIKAAYLLTMTMWHAETVAIVEQGLACGEFHSTEPPADIAWRFIALVCGLDGIYALGTQTWTRRRLAVTSIR